MRATGHLIYASDYHELRELGRDAVLSVRSAEPYPSVEVLEQEYGEVVRTLRERNPRALLLDLRLVRGRNDPSFEAAIAPLRKAELTVTRNTVIIVGSAAGQLQVKRHMQQDGLGHVEVLRDEDEARRLVRER